MTLLVRDEADIIKSNLLFHLNSGVDHIVVMDNNSRDGTVEIVEEFVREGVVDLIHQPERGYHQNRWVTSMAAYARDRLGADWIINADADEFWLARGGDLKSLIAGKTGNILFAWRQNSKRSVMPTLPHAGFVRQDVPHATSEPQADGEVAGVPRAARLELVGDLTTLWAPDLEAALVAEALRADPRG